LEKILNQKIKLSRKKHSLVIAKSRMSLG